MERNVRVRSHNVQERRTDEEGQVFTGANRRNDTVSFAVLAHEQESSDSHSSWTGFRRVLFSLYLPPHVALVVCTASAKVGHSYVECINYVCTMYFLRLLPDGAPTPAGIKTRFATPRRSLSLHCHRSSLEMRLYFRS